MDELAEKPKRIRPDNYRGNTLSVIVNAKAKSARALLAFPAGPVGCHLSESYEPQHELTVDISPFLPISDAKRHRPYLTTFRPSSQPVESFPTEILQTCSSSYLSGSKIDRESHDGDGAYIRRDDSIACPDTTLNTHAERKPAPNNMYERRLDRRHGQSWTTQPRRYGR